ncbi:MAG: sensor histidine kinase [Methyloligella sp. ZOD6]
MQTMQKSLQQQSDELDEDRKALEHIARALSQPAEASATETEQRQEGDMLAGALESGTLAALIDALPTAIALMEDGELLHGNAAFANAFGYRHFGELRKAGGLETILPAGLENAETILTSADETVSQMRVNAMTSGRRQLKVVFERTSLQAEPPLQLLRLIDQSSTDPVAALGSEDIAQEDAVRDEDSARDEGASSPSIPSAMASQQFNFLAKVSHEVRTPLNSILGFTELMMGEKLGPIGNPRYKGYIEDIYQSGRYALSLLNDLLDLSKIEAGEFELDFTAVEIGELVDECLHLLQPMAKRERILLRVSLDPDLPAVIADPRRLKQILLNLLSNAIKFTREGGQVILSGSTTPGGAVRLRIRDNGVGMTADEIQLAMQPFQQLDTTPRKQNGTGLGLPLTKALIEANRARFMLTSEAGQGTSADVIFPKNRVASPRD